MFCKSNSIKCKLIILILFILFIFSVIFGNIYNKMNDDTGKLSENDKNDTNE
jgi:hypothetical protein